MKIGLFFGSFNPMHLAHKTIATHILKITDITQIWIIVSPQNPFKKNTNLIPANHRIMIAKKMLSDIDNILISEIELDMPTPSYTFNTLECLEKKYPDHEFSLIIGEDNGVSLNKWYRISDIMDKYKIYIFPRNGYGKNYKHKNIKIVEDFSKIEISATCIRENIKKGKNMSHLMNKKSWQYIVEQNLYN